MIGRAISGAGARIWLAVGLALARVWGAAAEDVPDEIGADAHWTTDGSPYVIQQDSTLADGATLTVDPGVEVQLAEGCSLTVAGTLVARGEEGQPVSFVGLEGARWGSVVFEDGAGDAVFDGLDTYAGGSILEHCRIEGGSAAVQLLGASPLIRDCEFVDNAVDAPEEYVGGAALRIGAGSAPRVVDCRFEGNEVSDPGWGGAIYARDAAPVVQGNTFEDNRSSYGGALSFHSCHSPIVGNTFRDNTASAEGGGVSLYSSSPAFLDNVVQANLSMWADGGGVHVCVDCRPHANPIVIDNDIVDNAGLYDGAGGIGAAYLRVFTRNNVVGNTVQDEPYDLGWFNDVLGEYPAWVTHPDLSGNWWGTTDLDAIEDAVFHGEDDPLYGVVEIEPPAGAELVEAWPWAVVTTREIRYASTDQEMPVYLTLYNPGEEALDALLVLVLSYGERVRIPYSGPLDLPGAEATAAGHRLTLPAGAVMFTELMRPVFDGETGLGSGTWHALLFDAESGDPITEVLSARFEIGEGE